MNYGGVIMFLNQLNEDQKEMFLQLCYYAVMADGQFDQLEMETISRLCYEMMIPNHMPDTTEPLADVLETLQETCSPQEIRIIIFELMLLLRSDGTYNEAEQEFLDYVVSSIQLSYTTFKNLDDLTQKLVDLTADINKEIEG